MVNIESLPTRSPSPRLTSLRRALAGAATVGLVAAVGAPAASARQLNVRDEGRLRFVRSSGSNLFDEGPISGTIRGRVRLRFTYTGDPRVTAALTIYGSAGSISARATGRLSSPTSTSPSFRGTLSIVGGTGRYAHASGSGELFGVFYRRSYGIVVQTIGKLRY
jgi:hypothetical protein